MNVKIAYKEPWIVSDNQKFIGAIYTTKRGNEIVIKKDSTHQEILFWVSSVAMDQWKITLDKDNIRDLIDIKIGLYTKLLLNYFKLTPFLKEEVKKLNVLIEEHMQDRRKVERNSNLDIWIGLMIKDHVYQKERIQRLIKLNVKPKDTPGYITDEDIERARQYPIDSLLDFSRSDFCNCIFHSESTPSMKYYRKTNHVYCFGECSRAYDAISVYRHINNCDFITAVKNLI